MNSMSTDTASDPNPNDVVVSLNAILMEFSETYVKAMPECVLKEFKIYMQRVRYGTYVAALVAIIMHTVSYAACINF